MKTPFKARLSQIYQRARLTLRYWLRLPIDDIREQQRVRLDQHILQTLQNESAVINQMQARLHWYEMRVPLLKKEYKAFTAYEKKLMQAEKERQQAFKELVEAGVPELEARNRIWPPQPEPIPQAESTVVGKIKPKKHGGGGG